MTRLRTLKPQIAPADMRTAQPEPKQAEPFYHTKEWREARQLALALANYFCAHCGVQCRRTPQDSARPQPYVDHIREIRDGGSKLHQGNLQVLCGSCHTAKTHRARGDRQRQT